MAIQIVGILDATLKIVRTKDDREERINLVVVIPKTQSSFVLSSCTREQLRNGQGPFAGQLAGNLPIELLQRIGVLGPAALPMPKKKPVKKGQRRLTTEDDE